MRLDFWRASPRLLTFGAPIVGALVLGASYWLSYQYFKNEYLDVAQGRAEFFGSTLESALARFDYLPFVLSTYGVVQSAGTEAQRAALSRRLADFAAESGVDAIYYMDPDGLTVASSNYAAEKTFLGQNYGFRPYFQQAAAGGRGAYYAIGATTALPGFFFAAPVYGEGRALRGVIAVKVDLSSLQASWRWSGEAVVVENGDGVIVLASDSDWLYRTLRPLDDARREEIADSKQFPGEDLRRIEWAPAGEGVLRFAGQSRFHAEAAIERVGWRLHFLAGDEPVRDRALLTTLFLAAALSIALLAAIFLRSERLRAALQTSNRNRLTLQRTNAELVRARDDLAKATKMAALGQVAAAVTHELGQPISAMRNYLAAAEMCERPSDRAQTLERLGSVLSRLEHATRQLKDFARTENRPDAEIDLREVLEGARMMTAHDAEAAAVALQVTTPGNRVSVLGDHLRLEQAVVNLTRNAIAAMEGGAERRLTLRLRQDAEGARIEVEDTGCGLGARTLEELQEPFLTTRPSGEGMGLGLAITAAIMREHGGAVSARDRPGGGAIFTLSLPSPQASAPTAPAAAAEMA